MGERPMSVQIGAKKWWLDQNGRYTIAETYFYQREMTKYEHRRNVDDGTAKVASNGERRSVVGNGIETPLEMALRRKGEAKSGLPGVSVGDTARES